MFIAIYHVFCGAPPAFSGQGEGVAKAVPAAFFNNNDDVPAGEKVGVAGWMTLGDVSDTFSIPLEKLTGRFDVSDADARTKTIGELGLRIDDVQVAVDRYWKPEEIQETIQDNMEDMRNADGSPVPEFVPQPEEETAVEEEAVDEAAPVAQEYEEPPSVPRQLALDFGLVFGGLGAGYYLLIRRKKDRKPQSGRASHRRR